MVGEGLDSRTGEEPAPEIGLRFGTRLGRCRTASRSVPLTSPPIFIDGRRTRGRTMEVLANHVVFGDLAESIGTS